jgi:hypothetical protein
MRMATCLSCLFVLGSSVLLAACPKTGEEFDAFGDRYCEINECTVVSSSTGPSQCETPVADEAEVTGQWLFTLSARLDKKKAFVLNANITAEFQDDGSMLIDMSLQPLSAMDQMTPAACPTIELTDLLVNADGSFNWLLAPNDMGLTLCGEANPISGGDILTGLSLSGTICGGASAGFICGGVGGIVTTPIPNFDLTGSTFTIQKIMGAAPPPVINCEKEPAEY